MENTPKRESLPLVIANSLKNSLKNSPIQLLLAVVCTPLLGFFLYTIASKYGPLRAEAQFDLSILFVYLLFLLMLGFVIGVAWLKWLTNKKRTGPFPWRPFLRNSILLLALLSLGIIGKIVTDVNFLKCLFLPCVPPSVANEDRSTHFANTSSAPEAIPPQSGWETYSAGKTGITLSSPGPLQKHSTFPGVESYAYSSHSLKIIVSVNAKAMSKQEVIEIILSGIRMSNVDITIDKHEEKTFTAAGLKALLFSVTYHLLGRELISENVIFSDKTQTRIVTVAFLNSDTNQTAAQNVIQSIRIGK